MQQFMSCSWDGMSLIAELKEGEYKCISKYSSGNLTQITNNGQPLQCLRRVAYHDTIEEAQNPGKRDRMIRNGQMEDRSIISGRPMIYDY